jgi:uncharacterized protein (TIGR01319 family)
MDIGNSDKQGSGAMIKNLKRFCLIDVGSTTTKAILFTKDTKWSYSRREAPTTVEKPYEDVTYGVLNALRALENETGEILLRDNVPCLPCFSTSSAGGGLAIVVAGLVAEVTAKSAERVALGAGAIVQDVIALNDDRTSYKKIETLKTLRPDMVLLAGGFDNGTVHGPVYLAELLNQSGLRPKLAERGKLPVIYAGNTRAQTYIKEQLAERFIYHPVPNLRPSDYQENLDPAREAIHDVFMDHVMSRAPGYNKYKEWISAPILPTPAAVGRILELVSKDLNKRILAIDIGGATTDIFTAENGRVVRTVSANLGMSYSILNVVNQAGVEAVMDLLNLDLDDREVLDRIGNKYLRPTTLPDSNEDTIIECAVASIAIREAIQEHLSVLHGISLSLTEEEMTRSIIRKKKGGKSSSRKPTLDYDLVIGSGGKLSHSPRETAAMILTNAICPEGTLDLAVDSVFMFPQLGVLSQENPELALELFYEFGLVRLGKVVAPSGTAKPGKSEVRVSGMKDGSFQIDEKIPHGEVRFIPVGKEKADLVVKPGKLKLKNKKIHLDRDSQTLIIDARGRPPIATSGYRLPDDYQVIARNNEAKAPPGIYQGEIIETRELAVPGEIFVKPGDMVAPGDMIAKSSQAFLRPFFLHVADVLRINPEELTSCLNKRIGDEIKPGEVIARKKRGINVKDFVSPVSGIIENIIPDGTVIAREKADFAKKSYVIDVARDLDIKTAKVKSVLGVEVGNEVEKGQLLAGNLIKAPSRISRSPIRGIVADIDVNEGTITIEPLLEELELNAWISGKVESVSDRGCVISNKGTIIPGIWGNGEMVYGSLSINDGHRGEIVAQELTGRVDLEKFQSRGIGGLITGGLHFKEFRETTPGFAVVLTDGFGRRKMNPVFWEQLCASSGKNVSLDPRTQLRAGVTRPRIILTDN